MRLKSMASGTPAELLIHGKLDSRVGDDAYAIGSVPLEPFLQASCLGHVNKALRAGQLFVLHDDKQLQHATGRKFGRENVRGAAYHVSSGR